MISKVFCFIRTNKNDSLKECICNVKTEDKNIVQRILRPLRIIGGIMLRRLCNIVTHSLFGAFLSISKCY